MIRNPLKTLLLFLGLVGLMIYAALPSSTTPTPTTTRGIVAAPPITASPFFVTMGGPHLP
jgi:hypothetical protein